MARPMSQATWSLLQDIHKAGADLIMPRKQAEVANADPEAALAKCDYASRPVTLSDEALATMGVTRRERTEDAA